MPRMTDPDRTDQTSPRDEQIILGVDTHKDVHVAAVITVLGVQLATAEFATTRVGYRRMLAWARNFGVLRRAGVEGTGSYGAALTRHLRRHDVSVVEVNRPDRATRRRRGKTDAIDAVAAAHAVLSGRATTTAKTSDGPVEILRMFKLARASAVKARTQAINQLKAVIVGADPALRETLTTLNNTALIRYCATLPDTPPRDVATATTYTLRRLAHRIQALTREAHDLQQQTTTLIEAFAPTLLQRHGVGPDSAAALLITAGDNPDRLISEASFAALCGVSPIRRPPATRRRRVNPAATDAPPDCSGHHHGARVLAELSPRTLRTRSRHVICATGRLGVQQTRLSDLIEAWIPTSTRPPIN
jgi:transposase